MEDNLKPLKINIAQLTFSVFELVRKVEMGNIKLQTEFKRYYKWDYDKKSKLIESILLNIPIQPIYLSEENDYIYEVLDGEQRITTIMEFVNNKFKLKNTGMYTSNLLFRDLERSIQRKIEDYILFVYIIGKDTDEEMKFKIFERINTGATKLNSQEIRNYIYRNKGIPFIIELVNEKSFKELIKDKNVNTYSMQDQELVLRFMTFYFKGIESYTGNLKKFLSSSLDDYEQYRYREEEFKQIFLKTINNIDIVFGKDAFLTEKTDNIKKGKLNVALFEILMISFSKYNDTELANKKEFIKNKLEYLLTNNKSFRESIKGSATTTKVKTYERFRIWETCLKEVLGGK